MTVNILLFKSQLYVEFCQLFVFHRISYWASCFCYCLEVGLKCTFWVAASFWLDSKLCFIYQLLLFNWNLITLGFDFKNFKEKCWHTHLNFLIYFSFHVHPKPDVATWLSYQWMSYKKCYLKRDCHKVPDPLQCLLSFSLYFFLPSGMWGYRMFQQFC